MFLFAVGRFTASFALVGKSISFFSEQPLRVKRQPKRAEYFDASELYSRGVDLLPAGFVF
jgi:hypothetical protein